MSQVYGLTALKALRLKNKKAKREEKVMETIGEKETNKEFGAGIEPSESGRVPGVRL